ncbi:hypothetical protein HU200_060436 [Digitaria exilis]|uniref:F-box domain-containing protein n=1 Tax=Digitaria exilis TaxID=1010633 RepID=A0A835AA95_9POAL|nr:hypothetical protein HU200_060436 [Digitaria exilis]
MEGRKGAQLTPAPVAAAAVVKAVFGSEGLIREIILRLEFPTCLVRAAAVCKRWLRHASDPDFLRRFRERCPPRLLGFYFQDCPPAAAIRARLRGPGARHPHPPRWRQHRGRPIHRQGLPRRPFLVRNLNPAAGQHAVFSPLHPTRGVALLPPPPRPTFNRFFFYKADGGEDGVMALELEARRGQVQVVTLQYGVWAFRTRAAIQLPYQLSATGDILPPIHGKMYIQNVFGYILVLDLADASFSAIHLPDRVRTTNFRLSCGEDSGLSLIRAEGFLLTVWNYRTDNNGLQAWVLVADEICVHEASNSMEDVFVVGANDDAKFVLLGLARSGALVSMHLRSRIEKLHHERFNDLNLLFPFPFMMTWPPVFPALREENDQEE